MTAGGVNVTVSMAHTDTSANSTQ